ncbi:MAG: acyl-CoA dehydrogenase [Desulfobacteraceae bacterium]|nr:acyl-CoA dehydrogenase [Desulfobacteraceae bacterium]MBU4054301.1 acyl-CoA dehydrogenase family protein [Pseudomonadota bacterium]
MDLKLTDKELALKQEYADFFEAEMKHAPHKKGTGVYGSEEDSKEMDDFRWVMMKKVAEKGWHIMAWPKEYGGREAPIIEQLLFNETQEFYGAPGVDGMGVKLFGPTLILHATEDQKKRLLPPIVKAEVRYCQGWSEPNAGSDLASLETTAIKNGDHYVVNGQKIWTSGAHHATHMFLLARTDPNQKRSRGLSVFNVDMKTPGIKVRPIKYMDGSHMYNEVFFTDVKIPAYDLIGEENNGWAYTRNTMNFERANTASYIRLKRSANQLMDYLKTTKRDGKLLIDHPIVRYKMAKIIIDIELGRSLAYKIAWLQMKGKLVFSPAAASENKVFQTELRQRLANFGTEMMGLYGQLEGSEYAPMEGALTFGYQSVLGATIASGSSEVQRNLIAWNGLGLPRYKLS